MIAAFSRVLLRKGACRFGALLLVVSQSVFLEGCISNSSVGLRSSSSSSDLNSLSDLSSSSSDGAKGQCSLIDTSDPERQICIDCYTSVLQSRCPGKSDPSDCVDPTIKNTFTNLVNQCVSQTVQAGFTCSVSCSGGMVLNPSTCTCVTSSTTTTGPVGAGGSTHIDNGQTDFGPPVVNANWPLLNSYLTTSTAAACAATVSPIYLMVRNRGNTIASLNSYYVENDSCEGDDFMVGGVAGTDDYIQSAATPKTSSNGTPYAEFAIKTAGQTEFTSAILNENFGAALTVCGAATCWSANYDVTGGTLNRWATSETVTVNLGTQAAGNYQVSFSLIIDGSWDGSSSTNGPDRFIVTANSLPVFNHTFHDTNPNLQSYTPAAHDADAGDPETYAVVFTFTHSGGPLTLSFAGNGLQAIADETWSVDNLVITRAPVKKCAIKYTVIDSNLLSSTYCLRFAVKTFCESYGGGGMVKCACRADPDSSDFGSYLTSESSRTSVCLN